MALFLIWPVLAAIERIIASYFEIMLEMIFVIVNDRGCICQNHLNLRLLVFVEP